MFVLDLLIFSFISRFLTDDITLVNLGNSFLDHIHYQSM